MNIHIAHDTKLFVTLYKMGKKAMKYPFPVPSPNPNYVLTITPQATSEDHVHNSA